MCLLFYWSCKRTICDNDTSKVYSRYRYNTPSVSLNGQSKNIQDKTTSPITDLKCDKTDRIWIGNSEFPCEPDLMIYEQLVDRGGRRSQELNSSKTKELDFQREQEGSWTWESMRHLVSLRPLKDLPTTPSTQTTIHYMSLMFKYHYLE